MSSFSSNEYNYSSITLLAQSCYIMNYKAKPFKNALNFSNRTTAQFQSTIEKHQNFLQLIRSSLPGSLANQAKDCVVKDTKLLIYTDSAAWASQLRFYSQAIRTEVNSKCNQNIDKIQLKVLDPETDNYQSKPTLNIPSLENIELIRSNQLDAPDSELKRALLNLSQTLKKLRRI
jgi:hypothetical protein